MRSATVPMDSMSALALKMPSSTPGKSCAMREADDHDADGVAGREPQRAGDAVRLARAIVVADNGHHAVVETEHRHEHKALQLEVDAEHGHRRAGEADEDGVHAEGHDAADGVHADGGQTDGVDAADGAAGRPEAAQPQA